MKVAMASYWRF